MIVYYWKIKTNSQHHYRGTHYYLVLVSWDGCVIKAKCMDGIKNARKNYNFGITDSIRLQQLSKAKWIKLRPAQKVEITSASNKRRTFIHES